MWVMTGMEIENGSKLTHSFFPSSKYPPGSKYYSSHKYTCFLFQLVLCCQDAPELIAIKCYLALPGHCPQAQLKENVTTGLQWQIEVQVRLEASYVLCHMAHTQC